MDKIIKRLKNIYLDEEISHEHIEELWQQLSFRLPTRTGYVYANIFRYGLMALCVGIFAFGGIIGVAQAAKPSTPLYPVKILTNQMVKKANSIYHAVLSKHSTPSPTETPTNTAGVSPTASPKMPVREQGSENNAHQSLRQKEEPSEIIEDQSTHPTSLPSQNASDKTGDSHGQNQQDVKGAQTEQTTTNPSEENKQRAEEHSNQGENDSSTEHGSSQNNNNAPKKNN